MFLLQKCQVGDYDISILIGQKIKNYQIRRMIEKKTVFKFEDYVEPKHHNHAAYHPSNPFFKSLTEFKLDRIFPRNINVKLSCDLKENIDALDTHHLGKSSSHFKLLNTGENKFFNQYINLKEQHMKASIKKNKIAHIFNIKSINLIEKMKQEKEKVELDKTKVKQKHSSKEMKRNVTEKAEKDNYKGLNLILVEKKSQSPEIQHRKIHLEKKNSVTNIQRITQNKSVIIPKSGDNFETKLWEYCQYLKQNCEFHGLTFKEVENYSKNSIVFYVGRGNNGHLIKELIKKRWWWTLTDDKTKRFPNFIWTQLKEKSYYVKKQNRSLSTNSQNVAKRSESQGKNRELSRQGSNIMDSLHQISELQIHNHFENNEFLGNKKALYYNMKAFYEKQGKNVFDYLPVTFHVKRYEDEAWKEFTKYYFKDAKQHEGERRLWIVKPGENSNRGNGITIHSDYQRISKWVQAEISGTNNLKKTFIIQKYIDRPFLYNKRKFDIRCYMLLVRLNGKTKGYWYNEGYIRTSCYEYQTNDTDNEFIHLTNDAIQVNCDKYGKYEDGNKLSYHNFQKYLDNNQKGNYNFVEDICPQLKKIATDSMEATCHLLGDWNGLPTFEIFGLDFMIDEHFKPWLIQINTNPCLQTSSATLERVIPRMVDNAFKLSLDLLFPPPQNWLNSKKHFLPTRASNNPFQLVFDESKTSGGLMSNDIIMQMGEIEEDNQIYDQNCQAEGGKQLLHVENE